MDARDPRYFSITDNVVWNKAHLGETITRGFVDQFGKGPFKVVGLRYVPDPRNTSPVRVTIELPDGREEELTGGLFQKV